MFYLILNMKCNWKVHKFSDFSVIKLAYTFMRVWMGGPGIH